MQLETPPKEYCPLEQGVQIVAPELEYVPGGQEVHDAAPIDE